MSDQNTTPDELSDDQLEAAAGGVWDDGSGIGCTGGGMIIGGGTVKLPGFEFEESYELTPPIYTPDILTTDS